MNWDFYTSDDGGVIGFENHDHMSEDESFDYNMSAHWDVDQGEYIQQGPTGPGYDNYLWWTQCTILSISSTIVDEMCNPIAP